MDENWWELFRLVEREAGLAGRRVLDVGCGTGRLEVALADRARVWGVDPSPEMLEVARANAPATAFKLGRAEELPFKDGWFDRAVTWLVVHLLDRPQALAEILRVLTPDGRLVVATFDPAHFDRYWLNALFPSIERIDRARFPRPEQLEAELLEAGFGEIRVTRLSQRASVDRGQALERVRGRHISSFDLISDEEYEAGLARAEHELPERIEYPQEWIVAVAEAAVRPAG